MEQENKGQTIYFKDLFFAILYQWKWMLIAALIGAILLGGIQVLSSNKDVTMDTTSLTPEEQIRITMVQDTEQRVTANYDAQIKYLENSVLMSIDSYHAITSGIYLHVSPVDFVDAEIYTHQMASILRGYSQLLTPQALDKIAETMDMETVYLRELITMDFSNESYLGITARGRDQAEAEHIRDAIIQLMEDSTASVAQNLGEHTMSITPFTTGPRMDKDLYESQNAAHQKLISLSNSQLAAIKELDRLLPEEMEAGAADIALFAAIGFVLGMIMVVGVAFVMHLASGKVYSARVLQDRTELKILGCMPGKKRNALDRWLRKMEGRAQADTAEAVAANIANRTKDTQQLLLLGNYEDGALQPLAKALESRGKVCTVCAAPAQSAQAMDAIDQCQVAILVETCGVSGYENIIWEKNTIDEYGKQLLGCVVIDG